MGGPQTHLHTIPKALKITSMQYLCNIWRNNWVIKFMFCMLINTKVFYNLMLLFWWAGQAYPKYQGKFAVSSWHLKKEVKIELRDLTALAGSNTTLMIYYESSVLPPFNIFLSQYGIHTKPFLHLPFFR